MKRKILKDKSMELHGNVKVATRRGTDWRAKLMEGKLDARMNPTNLRLMRLKKGFNQARLAKQTGICVATYGSIERAKRPVSVKRAEVIAQSIGVPVSKLFNPTTLKNKMIANTEKAG